MVDWQRRLLRMRSKWLALNKLCCVCYCNRQGLLLVCREKTTFRDGLEHPERLQSLVRLEGNAPIKRQKEGII